MSSEHSWTVIRVSPGVEGPTPVNEDQLRSRIEQQSQLIAILKQRADANLIQSETYKKECESLTGQIEVLALQVQDEVKRRELTESRFDVLAKNHDEMIKLKDEYKMACHKLKQEGEELKLSNNTQSSVLLLERESELAKLRTRVIELEENQRARTLECGALENRCQQLECRLQEMGRSRELDHEAVCAEISALKSSLLGSQEKQLQLMAAADSKQMKIDEFTVLKEELEKLVATQEVNMKVQARTIDLLHDQLTDAQREAAALKEQFCSRAEEVSRDVQVLKLKDELQDANRKLAQLDKEFQAYKKHSLEALKLERELNNKLRHFTE